VLLLGVVAWRLVGDDDSGGAAALRDREHSPTTASTQTRGTTTVTAPITSTVLAQAPATATRASTAGGGSSGVGTAATTVPASCTWAGTWSATTFGVLVLQQTGTSVSGRYQYRDGRLSGTVSGSVLRGTWQEQPQGTVVGGPHEYDGQFEFTMDSACRSFSGQWRNGSDGEWQTWEGRR
jgi:hypothetical protein